MAEHVQFARRFVVRRTDQPDIHGVQFASGHCLFDMPEVGLGAATSIDHVTEEPHTVHWADETSVIRPGDTLLVRLRSDAPLVQQQTAADRLRDRLPGIDVLVIAAEDSHVYRPNAPGREGQ